MIKSWEDRQTHCDLDFEAIAKVLLYQQVDLKQNGKKWQDSRNDKCFFPLKQASYAEIFQVCQLPKMALTRAHLSIVICLRHDYAQC